MKDLIESKINGKEIVAPKDDTPYNVIRLMDALQASIDKNNTDKNNDKPKKRTTKKTKGAWWTSSMINPQARCS